MVISFANQKGGVGKTTSCVNIGAALAEKGLRVLLLDLDPQGNTTSAVGISKKSVRASSYDLLLGSSDPRAALRETRVPNLFLIPTNLNLAGAEFELVSAENRSGRLREGISSLREEFAFILIDCPPSLGMLTINALTASDGVLIPMQCEYFALEGLSQLLLTIRRTKELYNPALQIVGILLSMYNGRLTLSAQVLAELKKYYADKLFAEPIPRSVRVAEAPSYGLPITVYDPRGKAAQVFRRTADELLSRVGYAIGERKEYAQG